MRLPPCAWPAAVALGRQRHRFSTSSARTRAQQSGRWMTALCEPCRKMRPRWWRSRAAAAAVARVRYWPFSTGRFAVSGALYRISLWKGALCEPCTVSPWAMHDLLGTQLAAHPTSLPSALYLRLAQLTCRTCIGQPAVYARASTRLVMEWRGCLSDPVQARACTSIRACACSGCVIGGLMPRSTFCHRRQTCFNLSLCASHLFEQRSPCQM